MGFEVGGSGLCGGWGWGRGDGGRGRGFSLGLAYNEVGLGGGGGLRSERRLRIMHLRWTVNLEK